MNLIFDGFLPFGPPSVTKIRLTKKILSLVGMFSEIKAISEESLIDKLIELNISKSEDKSLADLITELDDTYLLETLFKAQ